MTADTPPFIIAIDGPAASGKGTLSRSLAAEFGLRHLDTGLTYRAVGRQLLQNGDPLDELQRAFAATPPGAVLDGRDIGTVVCPQANVKLFITASPHERAMRRFKEVQAHGTAITFEQMLEDINERDARDIGRADSPLHPASDAHLLDTSEMDIAAAFAEAVAIVKAAR